MADAHGFIFREVDRQAAGDLLRAPSACPSPVLPWSMPTAFPGHGRARNSSPAWSDDQASQSLLHIGLQCRIERKLRLLWAASSSLGVPLRCRRAILQAAASGGGVAPQLSGDRRCCPPETASDLLHGVALRAKEAYLLPLHKRKIASGPRLRRQCKHRWWHAACLPEPSRSYRRRHTGFDRCELTRLACRDRCPKPSLLISSCHRWPTW